MKAKEGEIKKEKTKHVGAIHYSQKKSRGGMDEHGIAASLPEFSEQHVRLRILLSRGAFADVYAGDVNGAPYVLKILRDQSTDAMGEKERLRNAQRLEDSFVREVALMQRLHCTQIVHIAGTCQIRGHRAMILEPMDMTLDAMLRNADLDISEQTALLLARDITRGLNWMHALPVPMLHRDLKAENVLVSHRSGRWEAKLADLGLAVVMEYGYMERHPPGGTPLIMAPETIRMVAKPGTGGFYNRSSDVYALGLLFYEIATRKSSALANTRSELLDALLRQRARPHIGAEMRAKSPALLRLAEACWEEDALLRPDCTIVLEELDAALKPHLEPCSELARFWGLASPVSENLPVSRFTGLLHRYIERINDPVRASSDLDDLIDALKGMVAQEGSVTLSVLREWVRRVGTVQRLGGWGPFLRDCAQLEKLGCMIPDGNSALAARILAAAPEAPVCLLRYSTKPDALTLCVREVDDSLQNYLIARDALGRFLVADEGPAFEHLPECLEYMMTASNWKPLDINLVPTATYKKGGFFQAGT